MDSFSQKLMALPRAVLVTLVLAIGIVFIVLSDPPKNVCDAQVDAFTKSTAKWLAIDSKDRFQTRTKIEQWMSTCQTTGDTGGCFPLFEGVRQVLRVKNSVSPQCFGKLGEQSAFSKMIWQTLDLMGRLAWGAKPPLSSAVKTGFLDASDISLFCALQEAATDIYGRNQYQAFLQPYFADLPGASSLSRQDAWDKMIFSVNCQAY